MAFYRFNWSDDIEYINSIEPSDINTEKITRYIKPDIKEADKNFDNINEDILLLAIKHFIDTSFKKDSDINKMSLDRVEDTGGDEGYDIPGIIVDMHTNNYMNIPNRRYREEPSIGKGKSIPLSFYFDISGSMFKFTDFLARLAFLLLKNGISIITGFNSYVENVILADDGIKSIEELKKIMVANNYNSNIRENESRTLSDFLRERNAEKCVAFADFDPYQELCDLSEFCKVYWFCFEERHNYPHYNFKEYRGNVYHTQNFEDMKNHFLHMDSIPYVDKQKSLILSRTKGRRKNGKNYL